MIMISHNALPATLQGRQLRRHGPILQSRFIRSRFLIMDDKKEIIGITDLLDEVDNDLEELKKKNPGDYSIKNTVLWWNLEKALLIVRHSPRAAVKKFRRAQRIKWMTWFFAGWIVMLVMQTALRFVFP